MVTAKKGASKFSKANKNKSAKLLKTPFKDATISPISKNPFASKAGPVVEAPITPKKPTKPIKTIKSTTGTIKIMPVTPKNNNKTNGFQEEDATPKTIGFKVRQIMHGGQDVPPPTPVKSPKSPKRKGNKDVKEPVYSLPKPKWTQSGEFLEETSIIGRVEQPQYKVLAKHKTAGKAVMFANLQKRQNLVMNSNALNFKVTKEQGTVRRQQTRALIQRKERRSALNKF